MECKCSHNYSDHVQSAGSARECTRCDCGQFVLNTDVNMTVKHNDPYLDVLDEMRILHDKKAADYGGNTGTDNLRASAEFGIQPWIGAVLRMNDKVTRIKSFVKNGGLQNESIEDSLIDIAAYAILALTLYREEKIAGHD